MNLYKRPKKKVFSALIFLVICLFPALILSFNSAQEPWTPFRIARARMSLSSERIEDYITNASAYRIEHLGADIVQIALVLGTDWPLESIGLVPLGMLLSWSLYYTIAYQLSRSIWTAVFITIFATWYYPSLANQYSTNPFVWTNALFLTFLLLLYIWLRERSTILSVLMIIVFSASFLHYQTTPIWIITAMATSIAGVKLKARLHNNSQLTPSWALPLFFLVVYLSFDTIVYGNVINRISEVMNNDALIQNIASKIIAPLISTQPRILGEYEVAPLNPRVATTTTLLIYVLLTALIFIWMLNKFIKVGRSKKFSHIIRTNDDVFIWSILNTAFIHTLIYSLNGAVSWRVIPLAFPFLIPIVSRSLNLDIRIGKIQSAALGTLSMIGFITFAPALSPNILSSDTGLASKLLKDNDRLLSDPNVYASILLNTAEEGKVIDLVWLDIEGYTSLVGKESFNSADFDYFVADTSNKPIISLNWHFLEPWTNHLDEINGNNNLNKIYDSQYIQIFQPITERLPIYKVVPGNLISSDRFMIMDTIRLLGTGIIILVLPGLVFAYFAKEKISYFQNNDQAVSAIVIGMSVSFITIVGYIVNFSPLRWNYFLPLVVIMVFTVIVLSITFSRNKFKLSSERVSHVLFLLAVFFIWSSLSTFAAHARTNNSKGYTEFFVSNSEPLSNIIDINVVNRESTSKMFSVRMELNGKLIKTINPGILNTDFVWVETWTLPSNISEKDQLVITLVEEGGSKRYLHINSMVLPNPKMFQY